MIKPCNASPSLPYHRREGAAHDRDLFFSDIDNRPGCAAGHWVLTSMSLPVHCASKGMLGTASDGICEAAISSRGGCVQHGHTVTEVNPTLVQRYVSELQRSSAGTLPKAAEGLSHLLTLWRQQHRLPDRHDAVPQTEADHWLLRYAQYLEQVCGTAASTRHHYVRMARRFLTACFGTRPRGLDSFAGAPDRGLCPARSGDQTRWRAQTPQYHGPLRAAVPRVQWGAHSGVGGRCTDPTSVDPCHTPAALNTAKKSNAPSPCTPARRPWRYAIAPS